jgi:hypothetical protein
MSSETSTDDGRAGRVDSGFQPWHFYFILAMAGATWAVVASRHTQPLALFVLSGAILAAGAAAAALHQALAGLFGLGAQASAPLSNRVRADLERDKALVLRSIKELEFDHAMRKVSDADFAEIGGRLRTRAMLLIEQLESADLRPAPAARQPPETPRTGECASCHTANDRDARFCKQCGARLS